MAMASLLVSASPKHYEVSFLVLRHCLVSLISQFVLENGVVFGYIDSGVVSAGGVDYTTLVIIHGTARLHAQAQANSLRIISVNRREYLELTAFIEGNDAERASLLEQQGRDLSHKPNRDLSMVPFPAAWRNGWFTASVYAGAGCTSWAVRDMVAMSRNRVCYPNNSKAHTKLV
ncbi:hypothetical protein DFH08DRAFT_849661 [Mycena albidolilacea]|uniref:Uncharacterized protein n=1 Tax=Mycena albidolilacea TaxID=1033008 RepID=A0AAD7AFP5_9AGAR|nr:hypothetical protein DFH08DRAFT_849661 [Mycena albidolilacea]